MIRACQFYIVNIMSVDAPCVARESAITILTLLNRDDSVLACQGLTTKQHWEINDDICMFPSFAVVNKHSHCFSSNTRAVYSGKQYLLVCAYILFLFYTQMYDLLATLNEAKVQHIQTRTKWPTFCTHHVQLRFREWYIVYWLKCYNTMFPSVLLITVQYCFRQWLYEE